MAGRCGIVTMLSRKASMTVAADDTAQDVLSTIISSP
jgi:hypothetical protein